MIKGFQQDYDYYRSSFSVYECPSNLPNEVFNEKVCAAETRECSKKDSLEGDDQHFKINYTNSEKYQKGVIIRLMNGLQESSVPQTLTRKPD